MRKSLISLFCISLAACVGDPNDPKTWIKKLDDVREQKEAVRQLVKLKDKKAVPPLIALYKKSKDPEHLKAIASFDDPTSVPVLVEALDYSEDSYDAASVAATALGEIGDKAAVEQLVKAAQKPLPVKSRANVVRAEAIKALGKMKDPRSTDALVKVMGTSAEEQDFFLNKLSAKALGEIRDPKAVPMLVRGLFMNGAGATAGANIFQECRTALIAIGEPSVDELIRTMKHENTDVEADAKKRDFFAGIIVDKTSSVLGDLHAKKAVPALLEQLGKKDAGLAAPPGQGVSEHQSVLIALGKIGDPSALRPVAAILINPKADYRHRASAADALNAIGDIAALPALTAGAKTPWLKGTIIDPEAARVAAASIVNYSRLADAEHVTFPFPKLDAELQETDMGMAVKSAQERLAVAKECGKDVACFEKYLSDANTNKGEKAAFMLSRMGKAALPALTKNVGHREPLVRLTVLFSIARVADGKDTETRTALEKQIELDASKPPLRQIVAEMVATRALLLH